MIYAIFGASRGCGLESLLLFVKQDDPSTEIHVLVRNKSAFLKVLESQSLSSTQMERVHIFVGDALVASSVSDFFQVVSERGHIDHIISSLGTLPTYNIRKPLTIAMEHDTICFSTMTNILSSMDTIANNQNDKKAPNLIVVSSNGMDRISHDALPMLLKLVYLAIQKPHQDKRLQEELLHKTYQIQSPEYNPNPTEKDGGEQSQTFDKSKLTIIRPSLLTSGKAKGTIRTSEDIMSSAWTISRKDVALYMVGNVLGFGQKVADTKQNTKTTGWKNGIVVSY